MKERGTKATVRSFLCNIAYRLASFAISDLFPCSRPIATVEELEGKSSIPYVWYDWRPRTLVTNSIRARRQRRIPYPALIEHRSRVCRRFRMHAEMNGKIGELLPVTLGLYSRWLLSSALNRQWWETCNRAYHAHHTALVTKPVFPIPSHSTY